MKKFLGRVLAFGLCFSIGLGISMGIGSQLISPPANITQKKLSPCTYEISWHEVKHADLYNYPHLQHEVFHNHSLFDFEPYSYMRHASKRKKVKHIKSFSSNYKAWQKTKPAAN